MHAACPTLPSTLLPWAVQVFFDKRFGPGIRGGERHCWVMLWLCSSPGRAMEKPSSVSACAMNRWSPSLIDLLQKPTFPPIRTWISVCGWVSFTGEVQLSWKLWLMLSLLKLLLNYLLVVYEKGLLQSTFFLLLDMSVLLLTSFTSLKVVVGGMQGWGIAEIH